MFDKKNNDPELEVEIVDERDLRDDYYSFFSAEMDENQDYFIRIFRKNFDKKKKNTFLGTYEGSVPSEDDIGEEFGRGVYLAYGRKAGQRTPHVKYIDLDDPIWDERKKNRALSGRQVAQYQGGGIEQSVALAERIVSMAATISGANNQNNSMDKSFMPFLERIQEQQMEMFKSNIKQQSGMYKELQQVFEEQRKEAPAVVEEPSDGSVVSELMKSKPVQETIELLKEYGEEWLQSKGIKRKKTTDRVKQNKTVQEILKDKNKLWALYDLGCEDENVGKDIMDKVFGEFGIEIKEEESEV